MLESLTIGPDSGTPPLTPNHAGRSWTWVNGPPEITSIAQGSYLNFCGRKFVVVSPVINGVEANIQRRKSAFVGGPATTELSINETSFWILSSRLLEWAINFASRGSVLRSTIDQFKFVISLQRINMTYRRRRIWWCLFVSSYQFEHHSRPKRDPVKVQEQEHNSAPDSRHKVEVRLQPL